MSNLHTMTLWSALSVCSVGLLGQTSGCDVNAIMNVFQRGAGGDDSGTNGITDADSNGLDDAGSGNSILRITAVLTSSTVAHGDAEYRKEGSRRRLSVELEDATVGSTHDVSVAGIFVGQLTIGALGKGELEFDTQLEPGHLPWPNSLPTELEIGTSVQVGPAAGTLGQ